jgi:hypothetical protein
MLFNFFKTKVGSDPARMIVYNVFCDDQHKYYDNYKSTLYILESIHQVEYLNKCFEGLCPTSLCPYRMYIGFIFRRPWDVSQKIRKMAQNIADSCGNMKY